MDFNETPIKLILNMFSCDPEWMDGMGMDGMGLYVLYFCTGMDGMGLYVLYFCTGKSNQDSQGPQQ